VLQPDSAEGPCSLPRLCLQEVCQAMQRSIGFLFFNLKTTDAVSCSQCLWLCRATGSRYAPVYPSRSVGCDRSSGLKIAIRGREPSVCCSNSCSLWPPEKRQLLAKLCRSRPASCTGSKILWQPLTTPDNLLGGGVWGERAGGLFFFFSSKPALQHVS